ncbi:MAG: acyltransferase [Oscillospiraceae bacterium]|nr:acyltransferase [Oscillospiraceae bacterium]
MNKETLKRIWYTFRLYTITISGKRADFLKKHGVFGSIGENCTIVERKVPLHSEMISLGNNVHVASKVLFITHDAIHLCLNNYEKSITGKRGSFKEQVGRISVGDNVFIGSNCSILYNVKIGNNVIVGAGTLVNKDIPDNSVAVGVPVRVIGSFDDFVKKRREINIS